MDKLPPLQEADLGEFTGSESFYRHWLGKLIYTDGVKFFADRAGAYWFLDIVATEYWPLLAKGQAFMAVALIVQGAHDSRIVVEDGDYNVVATKHIDFTDCPVGTWKFYLENDTLCLTSER